MVHNAPTVTGLVDRLIRLLCELLIESFPGAPPKHSRRDHGVGCAVLEACRAHLNNGTVRIPLEDISTTSKHVLVWLYGVTLVVACVGNLSVLVIFACNKKVRCSTNAFLVSLALSDLLVAGFTIPFSVLTIFRSSWDKDFQELACKLVPYVQNVGASATILTLCCICAERYLAIVCPLRARAVTAWQRLVGLTGGVWLISLVAAIPHAVWHTNVSIPAFLVKRQGNHTVACGETRPPIGTSTLEEQRASRGWTGVAFRGYDFRRWGDDRGGILEVDIGTLPVTASVFREGSGFNVCMIREEQRAVYIIYKWAFLTLLFFVPTAFMVVAYLRVGCRLWRRRRGGRTSRRDTRDDDWEDGVAGVENGNTAIGNMHDDEEASTASTASTTEPDITSSVVIAVARKLKSKTQATGSGCSPSGGDLRTRVARRVTLMLVTAMVLFLISWMPHLVFEAVALTMSLPTTRANLNARYFLEWLCVSNSCHNPIVYTLLHEKFRRILQTALTCRRSHAVVPARPHTASPVPSSRDVSRSPSLRAALFKTAATAVVPQALEYGCVVKEAKLRKVNLKVFPSIQPATDAVSTCRQLSVGTCPWRHRAQRK